MMMMQDINIGEIIQSCCWVLQFQDLKDEKLCANLMKVYYTACLLVCVRAHKIAGSPDGTFHQRMLSRL